MQILLTIMRKHIHRQENKLGEDQPHPRPRHWTSSPLVFPAKKLKKMSLDKDENRVSSGGSTEHFANSTGPLDNDVNNV